MASPVLQRPDARLVAGLSALSITVEAQQRDALIAYLALLAKWNGVYNLTSVRDPHDMVPVHLLDALSIVPLVDRLEARQVIDVGSGAGLPGIPLAIVRPALTVHSIDAVAKKIGFQLQVKASLKLDNLKPRHGRIEAFVPDPMPDLIVSRAFADLSGMVAGIGHLAGDRTRVLAMKGPDPAGEIAALPPQWLVEAVVPLVVPLLGAARTAVILRPAG